MSFPLLGSQWLLHLCELNPAWEDKNTDWATPTWISDIGNAAISKVSSTSLVYLCKHFKDDRLQNVKNSWFQAFQEWLAIHRLMREAEISSRISLRAEKASDSEREKGGRDFMGYYWLELLELNWIKLNGEGNKLKKRKRKQRCLIPFVYGLLSPVG